ncbi:TetR/AcrR family transcriptional regulator [Nocardia sp. NPDC050406]|uniref:TetR/AcrR family transcriptional regulator n=1 Tax=Nocardia sp. NPDC050406 TaxID=3364318 RepID=UPI00379D742D
MDAAWEIAGRDGLAALTVSGLCRATGVHDRYFYENFNGVDDVVVALVDEIAARLGVVTAAAIMTGEPELRSAVRAGMSACIEYLTDDPTRVRLLLVEAQVHRAVAQRRNEIRRVFIDLMRTGFQRQYGDAAAAQLGSLFDVIGVQAFGATLEAVSAWTSGDLEVTRDELIDLCADLLVGLAEYTYTTVVTDKPTSS